MKLAKNMILIKESNSAAFSVSRKNNLVLINYYNETILLHKEELPLDIGSIKYYNLLDNGYREAF